MLTSTRGTTSLAPARLSASDVFRVGGVGLRTRPLRAFLSALGIAIGIAAMIAVVGISTSSREDLNRQLSALGTNLLTVAPGQDLFGDDAHLPDEAVSMISRIGPVTSVSAVGRVADVKVYRNDKIPSGESGGIGTYAVKTDLLGTVGGAMATGRWLNAATAKYPAVVLGSRAAKRLGIGADGPDVQIDIGGRWFTVIGILKPVALAPELDLGVMIGWDVAGSALDFDGYATTVYCRSREDAVNDVKAVLAATANPEEPSSVKVSRPSDALKAKQATDKAFTGLLVGLGAVALLVGGVGVANTMVISVLERRAEIGLRRSLGATRGQVRVQFLAESLLLSALGGLGGVLLGVGVTGIYASTQDWPTVVPLWAMVGGLGATLVIGALAGLYPAIRAARLSPTEALATP